jgi:protein KTI12
MRFEAPDSRNRWDSPVFTVEPGNDLPFEQIHDALFLRKAPPPNLSTLPQPLSATNFLHELDTITQSVIMLIVETQKTSLPGTRIPVPGAVDLLLVNRVLSLMELQRLRRQFISFTKTLSIDDTSKISNMFVQFLNSRTQ